MKQSLLEMATKTMVVSMGMLIWEGEISPEFFPLDEELQTTKSFWEKSLSPRDEPLYLLSMLSGQP